MVNEKRLIDANALKCAMYSIQPIPDIEEIDNAPVDAVEVVHARWHDVYLMTPWVATGICSHCNLKSYINPDFPWSNYCPNCGAKMDGGNEDD